MNFEKNSHFKVLIAGGSGLIGQKLTESLKSDGHEIAWLSRSSNSDTEIRGFKWDINSQTIDEAALEWADIVIHLAGAGIADKPWTKTYREEIINSRVNSTNLFFKAFSKNDKLKPLHFLAASAVGYYGDQPPEKIISEDHPPGEGGFLVETGKKWEAAINKVAEIVPTCWLRTGPVLSTEGGMIPKVLLPMKLGSAAYFGDGKQVLPWIHIDDLVAIYRFALHHQLNGPINATAPHPVSNKEFTIAMKNARSSMAVVHPIPAFMLKIITGKLSEALLTGARVIPGRLMQQGFTFKFPDIDSALSDLMGK
jgi:uncharacterized protein